MSVEIGIWHRRTKLGYAFDSSIGFNLPNLTVLSPDIGWVSNANWEAIPETDRRGFAPLCPDFVVEIRSGSCELKVLKEKMEEYRDNGCRLGWLIYRENGSIEIKTGHSVALSGETMLPDLTVTADL